MALLSVKNLNVSFSSRKSVCKAVSGISFEISEDETLGLVGESGAGKSVACYSLLGLLQVKKDSRISGSAVFNGKDMLQLDERQLRRIRGKDISVIFQDPMTSLNPYLRIGPQIIEPLRLHFRTPAHEARKKAISLLDEVGIHDPEKVYDKFPHECSGGMRQRIMIAMALITNPKLLIADEPTTALDVTVQAQILKLMKKLKQEYRMSMILISHDLGVISQICDRVCVMYAGKIVEYGTVREILQNSMHPYTIALKKAIPSIRIRQKTLYSIPGMPPDLTKPISGCPFAPRCPKARDICLETDDIPVSACSPSHGVSCLFGGQD